MIQPAAGRPEMDRHVIGLDHQAGDPAQHRPLLATRARPGVAAGQERRREPAIPGAAQLPADPAAPCHKAGHERVDRRALEEQRIVGGLGVFQRERRLEHAGAGDERQGSDIGEIGLIEARFHPGRAAEIPDHAGFEDTVELYDAAEPGAPRIDPGALAVAPDATISYRPAPNRH